MKDIKHNTIFNAMEQWAPKHLAYDWDNVGLQIGSEQQKTSKVLTSLDVTEKVVDEAIDKGANLIIAHHPLLFKATKQINIDEWKGKIIQKILKNDISVYVTHTNFDIANGGMNDILCERLSIQNPKIIEKTYSEKLFKLIVYVPEEDVDKVHQALGDAGAGHIGNYSHCAFKSAGVGTFKPEEGANPHIGEINDQTFVNEFKLEMILRESEISKIITVLKNVHPYEEVAYDLIQLDNNGSELGLGRVGNLEKSMSLQSLLSKVKKLFNPKQLRYVGDLNKEINKVAIIAGSGEKYIKKVVKKGADVFITGDVTFHKAQEAKELGLAIIDPGHYVEEVIKESIQHYLREYFPSLTILSSSANTDPFQSF